MAPHASNALSTRKIKVLRIIARLNIGGPAIHVGLLSKGLDPERFTSLLAAGNLSPHEGDMSYLVDSGDVILVPIPALQREIRASRDLRALIRIFRLLMKEKPDLVHTHTAKAGTIGRVAVFLYNTLFFKHVKTVHTFHGHVFHDYFSPLKSRLFLSVEKILAKKTDAIIAISKTQKEELAERFRIAPAWKIQHVRLGFDLSPFLSCATKRGELRKRIGVDEETLLIAVIGRLVPIKNHRMFLDAARLLSDRFPEKKMRFLIIGDGELRDSLEVYVGQQGLNEHVCFCGWIKEIYTAFADLDILALTSLNEGTPVSIIEAMASSVPVIATDAGGVRDLLGPPQQDADPEDGFTLCERGVLCRVNDPEGLSEGLAYIMENRGKDNEARIRRAHAFAQEQYSSSRLIHDIETLYLELLGK